MYKEFDIVRVPFPFSEQLVMKTRPALVVSSAKNFGKEIKQHVLAMITSATNSEFPLDTEIKDYRAAGLPKLCVVRFKLYTSVESKIIEKVGSLSAADKARFIKNLNKMFPYR